ncbi:MAG: bifunctional ADP-heptose synthase [Bacteroidota bacterium]
MSATLHTFPVVPTKSDLSQVFSATNVLIVGDVMIDRYIKGSIDRISPEAPVPIVNQQSVENRLGGAANVALNIKSLGSTPYLCGVVGEDYYGEELITLLQDHHISSKCIYTSSRRRTTVKTRVMASHQHILRLDEEDTYPLSSEEQQDFMNNIKELLDAKEIDVILFQDYNKGVLDIPIIREVILEAIKRDIPTVVDPKAENFWEYKRVTLFKPNLREIAAQVPFSVEPNIASLSKTTDYIRQQIGQEHTLITLSEKGIFADHPTHKILPTRPRPINDVCGAGDAVISTVAIGIANDVPLDQIATLANIAGGQVCEQVGVVPAEVDNLLQEYHKNA